MSRHAETGVTSSRECTPRTRLETSSCRTSPGNFSPRETVSLFRPPRSPGTCTKKNSQGCSPRKNSGTSSRGFASNLNNQTQTNIPLKSLGICCEDNSTFCTSKTGLKTLEKDTDVVGSPSQTANEVDNSNLSTILTPRAPLAFFDSDLSLGDGQRELSNKNTEKPKKCTWKNIFIREKVKLKEVRRHTFPILELQFDILLFSPSRQEDVETVSTPVNQLFSLFLKDNLIKC